MIYCLSLAVTAVDLSPYPTYLEFILESIYFPTLPTLGCHFASCNICIGSTLLEEF